LNKPQKRLFALRKVGLSVVSGLRPIRHLALSPRSVVLTRDEFPKVRHEGQRDMHRTNRHGTRTRSATKSETGRQATISNVLRIVVHSDYPTTATLTRSFSSGPLLEVGVKSGVCCSQNTWDSSSIGPKSIVRAWPITAGHPARHKLGTRCSLMFSNAIADLYDRLADRAEIRRNSGVS